VLTDLKADAEILPVEPMNEDWLAHKVRSALTGNIYFIFCSFIQNLSYKLTIRYRSSLRRRGKTWGPVVWTLLRI